MTEQARAIRRFVERRPPRRPRRTDGFVIAAGKGGVGTSTAAILLALAVRSHGPVVLVDAHPGLDGLARLLGSHDPDGGKGVRTRVVTDGLSLIHPAQDGPVGRAPDRRAALRRAARVQEDATVIVDAGAHPATVLDALTDFGGALVTVVGPDGASAPAAFALAKLAWRQRPETVLAAMANRASDEEGQLLHEALRSAALRFTNRSVTWLGRLPESGVLNRPKGIEWDTIAEADPVVWHAAVRASRRLVQPEHSRSKPTLEIWE